MLFDGQLAHAVYLAFGEHDSTGQVEAIVIRFFQAVFQQHDLGLAVKGNAALDERDFEFAVVGQFAGLIGRLNEVQGRSVSVPLLKRRRRPKSRLVISRKGLNVGLQAGVLQLAQHVFGRRPVAGAGLDAMVANNGCHVVFGCLAGAGFANGGECIFEHLDWSSVCDLSWFQR